MPRRPRPLAQRRSEAPLAQPLAAVVASSAKLVRSRKGGRRRLHEELASSPLLRSGDAAAAPAPAGGSPVGSPTSPRSGSAQSATHTWHLVERLGEPAQVLQRFALGSTRLGDSLGGERNRGAADAFQEAHALCELARRVRSNGERRRGLDALGGCACGSAGGLERPPHQPFAHSAFASVACQPSAVLQAAK